MNSKMIVIISMFLTSTVVSSKRNKNALKGENSWTFPCEEDSVFGFMSGGDSRAESVLGAAWGVGTTVSTYFYPKATDFASVALEFGNMFVNWKEEDCNQPFKEWMYETFATKEEVKRWNQLQTRAIEKDAWTLVTNVFEEDMKQDMNIFAAAEFMWPEWVNDQNAEKGKLSRTYTEALDDVKLQYQLCATTYLKTAGTANHFEAFNIAALAAGSRCALDFYSILHLYYAKVINYEANDVEVEHMINRFTYYRREIASWEGWFDAAVSQIKARRNDVKQLHYEKYEGKCKTYKRSSYSCGWNGWTRGDQTTTYATGTTCVFHDEAFELDGDGIEERATAGFGYKKECGTKNRCSDVAKAGCDTYHRDTARYTIIRRKAPVLEKKLEEFRRKIFTIDFTKTTDVLSQMINGLKDYQQNKPEVKNSCALKKNHACGGSSWSDYAIFDSVQCMRKCNQVSWCKCITMNKSFGCRLERGHAGSRSKGENKYWALNEHDCPKMVESWSETAVATEQLTGEKVESAVAVETKKLKETNEALSAILRDLENQ